MNRIPFLIAGFLVFTVVFLVSCDPPSPGPAENRMDGKPVVAVIAGGTTSFWKVTGYGASQTAEKNDLHLVWQEASHPNDFDQQVAMIRNFAARRVQGMIIVTHNDLAIRDAVKHAMDQGIYVLLIDSPPLQCMENVRSQIPVVASNQFHTGQLAAKEMAGLLQEKGRVAIIRYSPLSVKTEHREKGFLAQMQSYPEMDVVGQDLYTGTDSRLAREKMINFLRLYSKNGISQLDGIFISDESTACEMLALIKQDEWDKKMHFVAFGSDSRLITGMLTSLVDAIFVEQPARMGQLAVDAMAEMLRGKTVAPFLDSGVHRVTMDNLFSPYSQALLNTDAKNALEILLNEFPDNQAEKIFEENQ